MNELITVEVFKENQEQYITDIIRTQGSNLPAKVEDINIIFELTDLKAQALKLAYNKFKTLDEQSELYNSALRSGQKWGIAALYTQKRMGEITRDMPAKAGIKAKGMSQGVNVPPKRKTLLEKGINTRKYTDAEDIANNPEVLEKVIKEAEESGDIPTRNAVRTAIKTKKNEERMKAEKEWHEKAVAEGRTEKTPLEMKIEEQQYLLALDSIICKLPKMPPADWTERFFNEAKAKAIIIMNRLEVFNG